MFWIQKKENAFEEIEKIRSALEMLKNPKGDHESPAKNCKDLALINDKLQDGEWLQEHEYLK